MDFLRRTLNLLCLCLAVLWSFVAAGIAIPVFLVSESAGHKIQRLWGKGWLKLMAIRVEVRGLENLPAHQAVVFAPNHESNFDIFVLASLPWDFKWVSKVQIGRIPLIGWAMRAMGSFLVRRDNSGHDLNVMREVEDGLRSGKSVVIFPEGTRTRSGELLPFKKGAFRTAQNAGVPLCPIAIRGTRAIAPPGKIPSKRGHRVLVMIGKLFPAPSTMAVTEVMDSFRQELLRLLDECEATRRTT